MSEGWAWPGRYPTAQQKETTGNPEPATAADLQAATAACALFSARRLRLAREARGLTQTAVASMSEVTSAAISQFEKGDARPAGQTLLRLARALEFPVQFFALGAGPSSRDPRPADGFDETGYFRSLRSISVADRRRALALSQLVRDLTDRLSDAVRLPEADVPRYPIPVDADAAGAEERAREVRSAWDIPPGPIPDVVNALERHGIVCARYHAGTHTVDAFSVPFPDWPVVILGDDKAKRDRERFSAAHELGHLVMHGPKDAGNKLIEDQAHRFAAAFLMPADEICRELPSMPTWSELLRLKRHWGVSIGALLMRARTLHVMPESTYLQAVRYMSMRGWRTNEPGHLGAGEAPRLLTLAAAAAEQDGVTISQLSAETGWPLPWVEDILAASSDPRPQLNL
jgi:Zn-dependent peptidase ImmA (M78 family)/transcriptional regulator with XRE-family HTH domain